MGWVQGLARSLVGDPNLAQDIAQETWLTAPEVAVTPTAADIVECGEVQQEVAVAVMSLAEPYRSVVLYRYLDGLSTPSRSP
jgi:DNA-directed RNA polymerase specialized sigma24 family protein